MRTKIGLCTAAAAAALAVPAIAGAGTVAYNGDISPSGTISFNLKSKHGVHKVTNMLFLQAPIACRGGARTASGKDNIDKIRVKGGTFELVAKSNSPGDKDKLVVDGKLTSGGAKGTLQLSGAQVPTDTGTGKNCDTGKLHWTATKS